MIKLFSLHLLCFSLCITTICAEENNKIVFGGATLGDSLSNVLKKLQRSRKNYVGPNVTIVDMKSKIQAATYRLDGSLDRSRSVNSMALYFSADNILAGFEIRYNTSNPYKIRKVLRNLENAGFKKITENLYKGKYKGNDVIAKKTIEPVRKNRKGLVLRIFSKEMFRSTNKNAGPKGPSSQ